ncbi:hypothetical protein [Streptomyces sp. NPDC097610]|uniref:hypothetical protein n=1 Tax=Streptomyces sp. NPDC097610 TaxID=3157227 RepID=UPI003321814E
MSVLLTPPGPDLRLLVSLAAWTWLGTRQDGREAAHILITHAPALAGPGTAETAEARMRRLSASLGGVGVRRGGRGQLQLIGCYCRTEPRTVTGLTDQGATA